MKGKDKKTQFTIHSFQEYIYQDLMHQRDDIRKMEKDLKKANLNVFSNTLHNKCKRLYRKKMQKYLLFVSEDTQGFLPQVLMMLQQQL